MLKPQITATREQVSLDGSWAAHTLRRRSTASCNHKPQN